MLLLIIYMFIYTLELRSIKENGNNLSAEEGEGGVGAEGFSQIWRFSFDLSLPFSLTDLSSRVGRIQYHKMKQEAINWHNISMLITFLFNSYCIVADK